MITAIIQARLGSTRLPGKTLIEVMGRPLLGHLVDRVRAAKLIEKIVVATTENPADQPIVDFATENGLEVYRGSEDDVLDRFYRAACAVNAETIVRVTPDCPLICPEIIDKVIAKYLGGNYDYVTNILVYTYPEGLDVEVFSFQALEMAWRDCHDPVGREHVTPFIRNSGRFKIMNVENESPLELREYKWSVDRPEDLEFVKEVFRQLGVGGRIFTYEDIINLLKQKPEIMQINAGAIINEGYFKSIISARMGGQNRLKIDRSLRLLKKAEQIIPGCSQTFSKSYLQYPENAAPLFAARGRGAHLWDVDGNEYLDFVNGLLCVVLGYCDPDVDAAVKKQMDKGAIFSLPSDLEIKLAEKLVALVPCAEMVRFGKNGSDATAGAIRVARAYTGRDRIACCGYHGWQDWYIGTTARNKGVPKAVRELTHTFKYNDLGSLTELFDAHPGEFAAVIMEPTNIAAPADGFLEGVRDLAHRHGALLIFDEIICGFRWHLGGAQAYYGVTPDLATFGKSMANGWPISAVVGRADLMKEMEEIFFSFTFGGDALSLAAALATIEKMQRDHVIDRLWVTGRSVIEGVKARLDAAELGGVIDLVGAAPWSIWQFKDTEGATEWEIKSYFLQEVIKRGILMLGSHNISYAHQPQDVERLMAVYDEVFPLVKEAVDNGDIASRLAGKAIEPLFKAR